MKKTILLSLVALHLCALLFSQSTMPGQRIFLEDITGRPLKLKGVEEVEGTPYLVDDWKKGSVLFSNGQTLTGVNLRFALYGNQLFFQKDEQMMEFTSPVKEFQLPFDKNSPGLFRNGYPATEGATAKTFYEVLSDGKYQLLKFRSKEVKEHKVYNEAVKQRFLDKEILYVYLPDSSLHILGRDKKSIVTLLPEKAEQINKWVDEKKGKFKSDSDFIALFDQLNKE